jgi:hypothetical protein
MKQNGEIKFPAPLPDDSNRHTYGNEILKILTIDKDKILTRTVSGLNRPEV